MGQHLLAWTITITNAKVTSSCSQKPSGDGIAGRRTAKKITPPWLFPYFCLCGFCNLEWTLINEDPDPQQSFLSLIESPLPFFYTSSPPSLYRA